MIKALFGSPQEFSWIVGTIIGSIVAVLAALNLYITYRFKRKDYKWQRLQKAESLIDTLYDNKYAHSALRLSDGSLTILTLLEEFNTEQRDKVYVTKNDVESALKNPIGQDEDVAMAETICFCFDELFYNFDRIERYIEAGLIKFTDVKKPFDYYMDFLNRDMSLYKFYIDKIKYSKADDFIERFKKNNLKIVFYGGFKNRMGTGRP
jgi:hypothetical protein